MIVYLRNVIISLQWNPDVFFMTVIQYEMIWKAQKPATVKDPWGGTASTEKQL